jgi:DNA polymerase (family X)
MRFRDGSSAAQSHNFLSIGNPRKFLYANAVRSILRGKPLWSQGVKGDLQMNSVRSDGSSSIQEMAEACEARGYEYIAITDHSKGLKIAGGIAG